MPSGSPPSKKSIKADEALLKNYCRRFGYTPINQELGDMLGLTEKYVSDKIKYRGFHDKEKIEIAKAFELTAQEFVDLFYPGYFRKDGNIKLDREVRYLNVNERGFDVFPWTDMK